MRIFIALFFACSALFAKVSVSVSVIPQAYFVEKIAGDLASVNIMVQKGKSPETFEPSIKELQNLAKSQLYFNIGMPFEKAWMKRFLGVNPTMKIIPPLKEGELEKYVSNSSLTRPSREFEKSSLDGLRSYHRADFSAQPTNLAQDTRIARANDAQNAESSLDSANQNNPSLRADSQNLRGNPPIKKSQNLQSGWLLRNARKSYGLPHSHSLARNDDSLLDSATHTHENHSHENHSHDSHDHDSHDHNSHAHNHEHLPHIWLSFILSQSHARQISDALCEADSANCATYRANLEILLKEISDLHAHFKGVFKGKGGAFLVYHPAFSYLASELGLSEFSIEVDGKDAKIAHTREIFELIKKHNIKSIFIQPQFSSKNAKIIAKEAHLAVKTADPLAKDWSKNIADFLNEVAKDNGVAGKIANNKGDKK